MALTVKDNTKIGIEIEDTEGTYKAPTGAGSFVQTLSDGTEVTVSKELLERSIFNGSLGKSTPRTGIRTSSGSVPTEARANSVAGDAPEYDALMRAAFGSRRQKTTTTTSKASGNTDQVLEIEDADIGDFAVNDIVLVKEAGDYQVWPITAVDPSGGSANITLLAARSAGAYSASVVIEKFTTYVPADSGHPSLSISKYVEDARRETSTGARVTTMSLDSFTTGQLPSFSFGFEGLDGDQVLSAIPFTPSFDTSKPPIILNACVYQDGVQLTVNEVTISMENTLGFATSTCAPNGRTSGRVTARAISGTFNPYKQDDDVSNFDKFKDNTEYSLFGSAYNPTAVAGEFGEVVAFWMPKCLTTEVGEADQDGLLQESISFIASRGDDATEDELIMSFM